MNIETLKETLATAGSAVFSLPDGKRLFLVSSSQLTFVPMETGAILVGLEGGGCYLWDITTPMNTFVLIENGFGLTYAPTLVGVLKELVVDRERGAKPRLEGPKDR